MADIEDSLNLMTISNQKRFEGSGKAMNEGNQNGSAGKGKERSVSRSKSGMLQSSLDEIKE